MSNTTTKSHVIVLLVCLLLGLCLLGYVLYLTDTVSVTFVNGDGTTTRGKTLIGFTPHFMPEPVDKPHYTFIGWEDENGELIWPEDLRPREDLHLTAKYMIALETEAHRAYMPLGAGGFAQPDIPLTRGEAAQMICNLYELPVKCAGHYAGKQENNDYYIAVGTLYTLKLIDRHERFSSDQAITRGELMELLTAFYPAKRSTVCFADLAEGDAYYNAFVQAASLDWIDWGSSIEAKADETITRGEAAALMNRILGRQPATNVTTRAAGKFPDMRPEHPHYGDLTEAMVSHTYVIRDGREKRKNWEKPDPIAPGRVFVDDWHYCVGEDGFLVSNEEAEGFLYDENGRFTTGMPELDALLLEITDEIITPNMTAEERRRAAFDYTVNSFTYLRIEKYKRRTNDWGETAAYKMLTTKYGNCYSYAAVFYELTRVLGEDWTLVSGVVGGNSAPHGWVERTEGKQRYVCDTELEMAVTKKTGRSPNLYMVTGWKLYSWMYSR
ncbi:MAG: transglutaminase domain-containing protein [Oscillospiraceae bacterium]|nr:transglutaminase domain-containing protein [Oscillospiraceae bacterium]